MTSFVSFYYFLSLTFCFVAVHLCSCILSPPPPPLFSFLSLPPPFLTFFGILLHSIHPPPLPPPPTQGSWWSNRRAVSPPSSSQDSMGEGGWDSPKPRPPDSPLWSMRVVKKHTLTLIGLCRAVTNSVFTHPPLWDVTV